MVTASKRRLAASPPGRALLRGVALLFAVLCGGTVAAPQRYVGEARDPGDGRLLYEEHHLVRRDGTAPRERLVLYRCSDGALFARKHVDYGRDAAAPMFELVDGRFGYREGVRGTAREREVFVRRDAASPERRTALAPQASMVIDAGFDEFVRTHWAALQRGEALTLEFLVPSRLETLRFKLRRSGGITLAGEAVSVFRLGLAGLLGVFVPSLEVSYRDRDRRLMRFEGLTNIRADREGNLEARIDFPPAREEAVTEPEAWARARAEPLTDCDPAR